MEFLQAPLKRFCLLQQVCYLASMRLILIIASLLVITSTSQAGCIDEALAPHGLSLLGGGITPDVSPADAEGNVTVTISVRTDNFYTMVVKCQLATDKLVAIISDLTALNQN